MTREKFTYEQRIILYVYKPETTTKDRVSIGDFTIHRKTYEYIIDHRP